MKKKVILTGNFGVGKTSLFNRFVYQQFSEKYLTTIGVKVDKKSLLVDGQEVTLLLWDIAGEISQEKVPVSYYLGASAVLYVFDLTRPSTYVNIETDLDYIAQLLPGIPTKLVANKLDLVSHDELTKIRNNLNTPPSILTSAKTGENVEQLFQDLAKELLSNAKE